MRKWEELPIPDEVEATAAIVRRVAIQVHREVGPGFREGVYQQCLALALTQAGCVVEQRVKLCVSFRDLRIANAAEADIIVNGHVVVELKARDAVHPNHVAQLRGYLQATGNALGLLFNFHAPLLMKYGYRRVVHPRYLQS